MRRLLVGAGWALAAAAGAAVSLVILFGVIHDYAQLAAVGGGWMLAAIAINVLVVGILFYFNA